MPKHEVQVSMPTLELGPTDVTFDVKADGVVLGSLRVSHGAVVRFSKNAKIGRKISWAMFDQLMREHGVRSERR